MADAKPSNLSECATNATCSYFFNEHADRDSVFRFKQGNYRLFWSESRQNLASCELVSTLWIKAPMNMNQFSLNTQDIKSGLINYTQGCICCNLIGVKPVSGYVKGTNTTPDKRGDMTKWLIQAEIVLASIPYNRPIDTIRIKQYFYPNFEYN
jgi:hypothetical protein